MMPINWWCKKRAGVSGWVTEPGRRRYGKIDFIGWWNNLSIGWCRIGQWRWEDGIRMDKEITLSVPYRRLLLLQSYEYGGWKRDIKLNKDDASRRASSYFSPLSALSGNKKNDSDKEIFTSTMKFFYDVEMRFKKWKEKKFACWFRWCRSQPLITRFLSEGMLQAGRKDEILRYFEPLKWDFFLFLLIIRSIG